ncbi:hypothetical protein [Aeromicrobium sp. UC242_57]|uniref:hypothetical protein n=1 Tax=Aeromicrobium sp. UC242_57 TaxID=3374624 RepID=UPI00379ADA9E
MAADPQGTSTLAVRTDGRAYGIGANGSSQLTGPPTTVSTYTALSEPADLDKVVEIAAGAATRWSATLAESSTRPAARHRESRRRR